MMPDEFVAAVEKLVSSARSQVIIARGPRERSMRWLGEPDDLLAARSIVHLAPGRPQGDAALSADANAAALGWVTCNVPRIEAGNLLLIQVRVRSDWYDPATEAVYANQDGLKWFAIVWKVFAKRLRAPMSARDVRSGDEVVYRSLYNSDGAEHWYRGGGRLRQEGVANVEYLIPSTRGRGAP
jgi:hypothetical protein